MLRVLIVDDDAIACDITRQALSEFEQVEVVGTVASGAEAMEFLKEKRSRPGFFGY